MTERETSLDERPHDVLAAEEFAMPAPDPELHHHGPISLPGDPTGIEGPHDVLAAEEFPMPAPRGVSGVGSALARRAGGLDPRGAVAAAAALGLVVLRRVVRGR
jgi:hypothetical protein